MKEVLYADTALQIHFIVRDSGELRVEIESSPGGPDLSVEDEVIVVVNGEGYEVIAESSHFAFADLGHEDTFEDQGFELMIRVHEFFEGWEFGEE